MTDVYVASRGVRRLAVAVCAGLWLGGLVVTHIPGSVLPPLPTSDKVLHAVGYFALACALTVMLVLHGLAARRRMTAVLIAAWAYGAFDEITQPLFGRSASWGDWVGDVIGAAVAVAVCETVLCIRARGASPPRTDVEDN